MMRAGKLGLVSIMALCASCSHLPSKADRTYGGFSQAHAARAFSVGPFSYVMAASFVFGDNERAPTFPDRPAAIAGSRLRIAIYPSADLMAQGSGAKEWQRLASLVARLPESLRRHTAQPVPVDEMQVYLVPRSVRLQRLSRSVSMSRAHTFRIFITYDPEEPEVSARRITRILAHKLFHVIVHIPRLRGEASEAEEQAANAVEHCAELDVFGSTSAPRRIASIRREAWMDSTPTGVSVFAGYGADAELDAAFSGKEAIERHEGDALHTLCARRAHHQLDSLHE